MTQVKFWWRMWNSDDAGEIPVTQVKFWWRMWNSSDAGEIPVTQGKFWWRSLHQRMIYPLVSASEGDGCQVRGPFTASLEDELCSNIWSLKGQCHEIFHSPLFMHGWCDPSDYTIIFNNAVWVYFTLISSLIISRLVCTLPPKLWLALVTLCSHVF